MQERSAPELRSRTIAGNNILNAFYMVIAALLLSVAFASGMSIRSILVSLAFLNLGAAFYAYFRVPEYMHRIVSFLLTHFMYRFRVEGVENIPKTGPAVLICNHVSFVDWLLISSAIRRPVRYVMDHSYEKGFIMRSIVKGSKIITIAPSNESIGKLREGFVKISAALRDGDLVVIFPEGSITQDGSIQPFKKGILHVLQSDSVPVVPMALVGMWGSLFSRKGGPAFRKRPKRFRARVGLRIGTPIIPDHITMEILKDRVIDLQKSAPL